MQSAIKNMINDSSTISIENIYDDEISQIKESGPLAATLTATGFMNKVCKVLADSGKKSGPKRVAALEAIGKVIVIDGMIPYSIYEMAPVILDACGDKVSSVVATANETLNIFKALVPKHAIKALVPILINQMNTGECKAGTVIRALELGRYFLTKYNQQLLGELPILMPVLVELCIDTNTDVENEAREFIKDIMSLIENGDVEPLLPSLIEAMVNPDETRETVHRLAGTTFANVVDAPTYSIVLPVLVRGFDEPSQQTKRMCAVVVDNMIKLALEPCDASLFIPAVLPRLIKCCETVADPEARNMCIKAREGLERLEKVIGEPTSKKLASVDLLMPVLINAADKPLDKPLDVLDAVAGRYICACAASLANANEYTVSTWTTVIGDTAALIATFGDSNTIVTALYKECELKFKAQDAVDDDDSAEVLCDCKFTLAYGSKILLHNTNMKLKRGKMYGLLGGNDCGKTTLMRAITNEQIEGFPPPSEVRTVFVEADIQGELSDLSCVDYVLEDPCIKKYNVTRDAVSSILQSVGFQVGGVREGADPLLPVARLSGGWRMKLALARAMLQNADILLMDEPTNHLDVINVAWVKSYIKSLEGVTCIIVSHDAGLLTDVCTHILSIKDLKLHNFQGNLPLYVAKNPAAKSFFEFKASEKMQFTFPKPSFIDGIKSRGKALMKMTDVTFGYPTSTGYIINDVRVQVSMASRVACVGVNGAGKSTMVKLLTGEMDPIGTKCLIGENRGTVWKHPGARVAYVAQHAFHHIEQHMDKTPNEYIKWRYQYGKDKETLAKVTMDYNDGEIKLQETPVEISIKDESTGKVTTHKRIVETLTGQFRKNKAKEIEYEVKWYNMAMDHCLWYNVTKLEKWGWAKMIRKIDEEAAQRAGLYARPLTSPEVEGHLGALGMAPEFATHHRIQALSGGQKVKVVLAAAMWMQPHLLILDEPTNYLDREALGALAHAIENYEGGVVIISHNNDFCQQLCPETWVMEGGRLNCKGDAEWMKNQDTAVEFKAMEEMTDASGNTVKLKPAKKEMSKKEKKAAARRKALKIKNGEPLSSESDEDWD